MTPTVALTRETAQNALNAACAAVGLDAAGAELIRIGSNAVYRLSEPVIVRIARNGESIENARMQVQVARWLSGEGYPATRALDVDQPVRSRGLVTTFWESASEREEYAPLDQVAELIRRLHSLDAPSSLHLPEIRPLAKLDAQIGDLANLDRADAQFLENRILSIRDQYERLEFDLTPGVIHGDANVGNVILDRAGQPILIDLDSFATGPREWDLVQTALFYERFGWHTEDEYRTFVKVYGYDIMTWPGYRVLADYREVAMTLWLCGKAGTDMQAAAEVRKRVESLRSGGSRHDWAPF
ncbi:thiamine kinase-like enzyme [Saccharopolyspora erythraea NRRL 2338]|uniref:Aminoglycoside phosphotransferase family protein n=1 Tax=Saccharopolyspora erythraea TaxID=1836 RepID=A0ABN1D4N4_SACER|nr:aminoglycoside phosphotransferase family protein [Saccharopolyspora erythraea]PFG93405.1 thiamine kinase-like enzyme [Saccharopolyspora erythraea NRRL 2338]QRK90232.1 aminoglycoside phosphotransferase family protein [Saccharopolyspora erythraea]QRK90250.1 aminoglycoside phosphotransferase family protein [Saccharopolyspora erythraea]QRK90257.1 aminoglycoside phosphotransferase family protein [Saccharopolyspora erythraea]QRK90281.1 aminoglycoside phosphotransferase family protein [Saccharopol